MDPERIVEAALFISPRPLTEEELCELVGVDADALHVILRRIRERLEGSVLIIEQIGKTYRMYVAPDVFPYVKNLAGVPEFTQGELKVIAYIASKNAVLRSELRKKFRSTDSALKKLSSLGLISMRKKGNTYEIKKTPLFDRYFTPP